MHITIFIPYWALLVVALLIFLIGGCVFYLMMLELCFQIGYRGLASGFIHWSKAPFG